MSMQDQIEKIVISHLLPIDRFLYGFSDLRGLLATKFNGFEYGIVIGCRLDNSIIDNITDGPTPEYYSHYRKINEDLARSSSEISIELNDNQIETLEISPTVTTEELDTTYYETLRTDVSHKMVATRAGLGWIGKTDLLITREFGPRLRFTSILLKEPLKPKSLPINKSRCGTCTICIEKCPPKAANGKFWNTTVDRDVYFDAHKCRQQCFEFGKERLSEGARVCGICVAVCPIGQ